jgi:hypothetical protein
MNYVKTAVLGLLCFLSIKTQAQLTFEGGIPATQPLSEYFQAEDMNFNKSIIYIFYNNDPCYDCAQTIALTEEIYNQYYGDRYSLFVINQVEDTEYNFVQAYGLNAPLSIVLVRIRNGQTYGWHKIDNPQNFYQAPEDYTTYITGEINTYLGNF